MGGGGTPLPSLPTFRLPLDALLVDKTSPDAKTGVDIKSWGLVDSGEILRVPEEAEWMKWGLHLTPSPLAEKWQPGAVSTLSFVAKGAQNKVMSGRSAGWIIKREVDEALHEQMGLVEEGEVTTQHFKLGLCPLKATCHVPGSAAFNAMPAGIQATEGPLKDR